MDNAVTLEKEVILKKVYSNESATYYQNGKMQIESLWQENAVKLHSDAIQDGDSLYDSVTPSTEFCICSDDVYFTADKKAYGKSGWLAMNKYPGVNENVKDNFGCSQAIQTLTSSKYPHFAFDGERNTLLVNYGSSKVNYFKEVDLKEAPVAYTGKDLNFSTLAAGDINTKVKALTTGDSRLLGCVYVPNDDTGLWIILSATRVYYCPANKLYKLQFDSIAYNTDSDSINKYYNIIKNNMHYCDYGDYLYAIGCGTKGEYIWIKISKETNTIVDYKATSVSGLYNCIDIVIQKNKNGLGTSPVFVCGKADKKLTFVTMDSPEDISSLKTYQTNIISSVDPQFAGFNSGQDYISFMYCGDGLSQVQTYILKFDHTTDTIDTFCTGIQQADGTNLKINGQYTGDYFATQVISCNTLDNTYPANYFSTRDGVHWYSNLGYLYIEDQNGNAIDVTNALKPHIVDGKTGVTGKFVGGNVSIEQQDDYYIRRFKIPDNITPSVIIAGSTTSLVDNNIEPIDPYINKVRYVSDWYGNQFVVKPIGTDYNADVSSDVKAEDNLIEMIFNITDGTVLYSNLNMSGTSKTKKNMTSNSRLSGGTCYVQDGYLCYKSKVATSSIFVDGRVYNWVAIE